MSAKIIKDYYITTEFTSNNAGMCQWAFARKGGQQYFIKQLLSPKYPTEHARKSLSPVLVNAMLTEAQNFFTKREQFYTQLYECRTGNNIVVQDFFVHDGSFFLTTERVQGPFLTVHDIAKLSYEKKITLLKAILYSVTRFHDKGIVHADLKPENILIRKTEADFCTAKIIDFDSGFFEYDPPDEIIGDQRYFSPETILRNDERDVDVTVKSDIFALGLLFHQYWCGDFPKYDTKKYESPSIALLNHAPITISNKLPAEVYSLIDWMLEKRSKNRPSARQAWERLSGKNPSLREWFVPGCDDL